MEYWKDGIVGLCSEILASRRIIPPFLHSNIPLWRTPKLKTMIGLVDYWQNVCKAPGETNCENRLNMLETAPIKVNHQIQNDEENRHPDI